MVRYVSVTKFPLTVWYSKELKNILSIRVVECSVILVGLVFDLRIKIIIPHGVDKELSVSMTIIVQKIKYWNHPWVYIYYFPDWLISIAWKM